MATLTAPAPYVKTTYPPGAPPLAPKHPAARFYGPPAKAPTPLNSDCLPDRERWELLAARLSGLPTETGYGWAREIVNCAERLYQASGNPNRSDPRLIERLIRTIATE